MKIKRKSVLKWLRKSCKVLPEETYLAYPKYFKPRFEPDEKGQIVMRYGYLQECLVNHYRRCKYLLDHLGFAAVEEYFLLRGYQFAHQKTE